LTRRQSIRCFGQLRLTESDVAHSTADDRCALLLLGNAESKSNERTHYGYSTQQLCDWFL
jgi:hypothetical protein